MHALGGMIYRWSWLCDQNTEIVKVNLIYIIVFPNCDKTDGVMYMFDNAPILCTFKF